jgi:hypothetical protein
MMGVIKVEFEITADEEKLLNEYLDAHCLDREKWLKRMMYHCLYQAVGKWRQPVGKVSPAFSKGEKKPGVKK